MFDFLYCGRLDYFHPSARWIWGPFACWDVVFVPSETIQRGRLVSNFRRDREVLYSARTLSSALFPIMWPATSLFV